MYGFDKLQSKSVSPSQTDKKSPSTPVGATMTPQTDDDIYSFDQLEPQVPRKSSNVKEDLHHIKYASKPQSEDIYGFDRLSSSDQHQQRVPHKPRTGYDRVPLPAKPKSPSPPSDNQEDYIEPMNEDDLKSIKQHQLSAMNVDQTYDRLQDMSAQQPPQLPMKKKAGTAATGVASPLKPQPTPTVEGQPIGYKHREPLSPIKVLIMCTYVCIHMWVALIWLRLFLM